MHAQFMHYEDPFCLEFTTSVSECQSLTNERSSVILERTYFYPTGGGQEHDTGTLGAAQVVDVFKDENRDVVIHIVEGNVPDGEFIARIDADRRQRHQQHHSAQHLLTHCFVKLFELETLSANINGNTPSTLDLPFTNLSKAELDRAEDLANHLIYKNLSVKSYFVTPEQLANLPLRKPPTVKENIRIVEIDGHDYSACGGTHVTETGMIGIIKIIKTERQNERLRVHFTAGWQALYTLRTCFDDLNLIANQMSVALQDAPTIVSRQFEQLQAAQKELHNLRMERIDTEAQKLAAQAKKIGDQRLVLAQYENRSPTELRELANSLKNEANLIAILSAFDGNKISVVITCAPDTGRSATDLLHQQLAPLNGRGGGSPQIAQGGGPANAEQFHTFFESIQQEGLP